MKQNDQNKIQRVLITGASKGIGFAIAKKLVQSPEKYRIYGTSRDITTIENLNKIKEVTYINLDLSDPTSISSLLADLPEIDILINNAACSHNGPVEEIPLDRVRKYFEINFFGTLALIQAYLPNMRKNRKGYIINISSMAGMTPVPFSTFYAASKAALIALTLGLESEVHSFGIKVLSIAPFEFRTTIPQEIIIKPNSDYRSLTKTVKNARDKKIAHGPSPGIVGDLVAKILTLRHPKRFYPAGKYPKIKYFFIKHLPQRLIARGTRKIFGLS